MRRRQMRLKKRITFEEWKAKKDREMKQEKEIKIIELGSVVDRLSDKRLIAAANDFMKKVIDSPHDLRNKELSGSSVISPVSRKEIAKSDDFIYKESGKLTFREWLHNKNIMERDKMRRHLQEQLEKERIKKERETLVNKAYNAWLIRSKYRTLQKYYSQLGEDKIREILLEDVSRLSLNTTKDIGVGDASIENVFSNFNL